MIDKLLEPIVLTSDSFVAQSVTPWAGSKIGTVYKNDLIEGVVGRSIGESWEFCVSDISLGSVQKKTGYKLKDYFLFPELVYGELLNKQRQLANDNTELLIKLIDTAQRLSFQVHPGDSYPDLKESECGKPEAWLIIDRDPGAGVYLGFKDGIDKDAITHALETDLDLEQYLQFISVEKYDYVRVPVETPHAIGAGITLIEPQLIRPEKRGKTYRISDWGRCYDKEGNLCLEGGKPRELHIEDALKLIDPVKQSGKNFLKSLIIKPDRKKLDDKTELLTYSNTIAGSLSVFLAEAESSVDLVLEKGFLVFSVMKGALKLHSANGAITHVRKGETVLVAHAVKSISVLSVQQSEYVVVSPDGTEYVVSI